MIFAAVCTTALTIAIVLPLLGLNTYWLTPVLIVAVAWASVKQ